jgi:hypothetical protein
MAFSSTSAGGSSGSAPLPPATNPDFRNVELLYNFDGASGQNLTSGITRDAGSLTSVQASLVGAPTSMFTTNTTGNPFKQSYSYEFRSSDNCALSTAFSTATYAMGTGDFCIEWWMYPTDTNKGTIINIDDNNSAGRLVIFFNQTSFANRIFVGVGPTPTQVYCDATTVSYYQWTHIALVRIGTNMRMFFNGVAGGTVTNSTNFTCTAGRVFWGCSSIPAATANDPYNGLISNFRITKGNGVYTGAFTVPNGPLQTTQAAGTNINAITAGQCTVLMTKRPYIANELNLPNLSTFVRGNTTNTQLSPRIVSKIPFVNQTFGSATPSVGIAWSGASFAGNFSSTGTNGVRMQTIGTIPAYGSATLFTWTWWAYLADDTATSQIWNYSDGAINYVSIQATTAGNLTASILGTAMTVLNTIATKYLAGQWNHFALVRTSGTVMTLYVNGQGAYRRTTAANMASTNPDWQSGETLLNRSKICNFSAISGTAVYTADFVPPTAPVANPANLQWRLDPDPIGIIDWSQKQDYLFSTTFNNSLNTSQTKFGTSSLRLAGAINDPLVTRGVAQNNQNLRFLKGPFTVEFWLWIDPAATGAQKGILQIGDASAGFGGGGLAIEQSSANALTVYRAGSGIAGTAGKLVPSSWIHIAVVREVPAGAGIGTQFMRVYINGILDSALNTTDTTNYTGGYLTIGGAINSTQNISGYMSNLRVSSVAVYTANFAVPTAAFPNV